ncbi:MAG: tetratricopeptide repeat protein [Clostridia bacterium]|nr:tetratricopeptide repeat protein [Clostridia bacterium]
MTKKDNILSFDQGARFYLRSGRKKVEEGDLVRALEHLRTAHEKDGEDPEITIALAEVLNRMQRFEESIRVIMSMGKLEQLPPDGIFGLASNFIAMEDFGPARLCLERYLQAAPNGDYAPDARDYLGLMADEPEMNWQLGLDEGEDVNLIDQIHFAKALHQSGRDKEALNHLTRLEDRYPQSLWLQMELALCEYCLEMYESCQQRLFNILKEDRGYVRARCLLAMLYKQQGNRREARELVRSISIPTDGSTEELGTLCLLLLELHEFERAEEACEAMYSLLPYDTLVIHQLAVSKVMLGKKEEARALYQKNAAMDPHDTVAAWYLEQLENQTDERKLKRCFNEYYDINYQEFLRRTKAIDKVFLQGPEAIVTAWEEEQAFRDLVIWCLHSPYIRPKQLPLTVLVMAGDQRAEQAIRDFLLRTDQADEDKAGAFAALQTFEGAEPYAMFFNGTWQYGPVRQTVLPSNLPAAYGKVFVLLSKCQQELPLPPKTVDYAQRAFYYFITAQEGKYRRLTAAQGQAMAAAFVVLAVQAQEEQPDIEAVCRVYAVTLRRLDNAMGLIFSVLGETQQ